MHWETKKKTYHSLYRDISLYCDGLESNLQYL